VEPQWRLLLEIETEKGRLCSATVFEGEEGEEVRRFHSAGGG
jgi:hypothetical protein